MHTLANNAADWLSSDSELFGLVKLVFLVAVTSLGITAAVRYVAEHDR